MIYAIQSGEAGPVKFGVATNPHSRLRELQTGNPVKLRLIAAVNLPNECERQIHDHLRDERIHGEWFGHGKSCSVVYDLVRRMECPDETDVDSGIPGWSSGFDKTMSPWMLDICANNAATTPTKESI
jgi:hypothetical protein